jgi:hypothetical protein
VLLNSLKPCGYYIYITKFKIKTFYVLLTQPLIQVRSQSSPCEICGAQSGTVTGLSPSTSVLPCQYHSTNASHSSSSTYYSYQKDKRAKPGNLTERNVLSETWQLWIEKYCHLAYDGKRRKTSPSDHQHTTTTQPATQDNSSVTIVTSFRDGRSRGSILSTYEICSSSPAGRSDCGAHTPAGA